MWCGGQRGVNDQHPCFRATSSGVVVEEAARIVASVLESPRLASVPDHLLLWEIDGEAPSFLALPGLEALSFDDLVYGLVAAALRVGLFGAGSLVERVDLSWHLPLSFGAGVVDRRLMERIDLSWHLPFV